MQLLTGAWGRECQSNEGRQQTQDLVTTVRSMTDSFNCNLMISGRGRREGLEFVSLYLSRGGKLLVRIKSTFASRTNRPPRVLVFSMKGALSLASLK